MSPAMRVHAVVQNVTSTHDMPGKMPKGWSRSRRTPAVEDELVEDAALAVGQLVVVHCGAQRHGVTCHLGGCLASARG